MLKDVAPPAHHGAVSKARRLRRAMSLPEVLVWQRLRGAPDGCRFRRQHPVGPYILDFYCIDARLAIEIDGAGHVERIGRDERRDAWLREHGVSMLRIPAAEVLRSIDEAVNAIIDTTVARLPLHHPAAPGGPPPRDKLGED